MRSRVAIILMLPIPLISGCVLRLLCFSVGGGNSWEGEDTGWALLSDSDFDGISDYVDVCPDEAGPDSMDGCPQSIGEPPDCASLTDLPEFPAPPPKPSAWQVFELNQVMSVTTDTSIKDVEEHLRSSLKSVGYEQVTVYCHNEGVALVTSVEALGDDGKPLAEPARWQGWTEVSQDVSLFHRLLQILFVRPGRYRMLAFLVSGAPIGFGPPLGSQAEAEAIVDGGHTFLPDTADLLPAKGARVTVLVYEFYKADRDTTAQAVVKSQWTLRQHLALAGLTWG